MSEAPRSGTASCGRSTSSGHSPTARSDRGPNFITRWSDGIAGVRSCPACCGIRIPNRRRGTAGPSRADRGGKITEALRMPGAVPSRTRPPRLTSNLRPPHHGIARIACAIAPWRHERRRRLAPAHGHRSTTVLLAIIAAASASLATRAASISAAGFASPPSPRRATTTRNAIRYEHRPSRSQRRGSLARLDLISAIDKPAKQLGDAEEFTDLFHAVVR